MDSEKFMKFWLPVIAWASAILVVSTLPGKAVAPVSGGIPFSSFAAHFAEFLVFSFLLHRALASGTNEKMNARSVLLLTVFASFAFSAVTEILQLYVPGRFFDYNDILTNDLGAIAGLGRGIYALMA